jgi:hypothetical protein
MQGDEGFSPAHLVNRQPRNSLKMNVVVKMGHLAARATLHYSRVKATKNQALAIRCPTCGAKPGEKCELGTGQPRTDTHRDRRLVALDKKPL